MGLNQIIGSVSLAVILNAAPLDISDMNASTRNPICRLTVRVLSEILAQLAKRRALYYKSR